MSHTQQPAGASLHGRKKQQQPQPPQPDRPSIIVTNWQEALQPLVAYVKDVVADIDGEPAAQDYLVSTMGRVREARREFHEKAALEAASK